MNNEIGETMSDEKHFGELQNILPKISHEIELILSKSDERRRVTKGNFNLFSILRKDHDEAGLHSRFLQFLLNPKESHDCGSLFLNFFLQMLNDKFQEYHFDNLKDKCISACTEKIIDQDRRIDIFLEFEESKKIAIEVKIWASEQPNQISDYATYINSDNKNNFLLFLTLGGRESETANGKPYLSLSYKDDIMSFVEACLQATYMYININQALQQYKKVIAKLTNQVEESEMSQIQDLIKKNPGIILNQDVINRAIQNIKNDLFNAFYNCLKDKLSYAGYCITPHGRYRKDVLEKIEYKDLPVAIYRGQDNLFLMVGLYIDLVDDEHKGIISSSKMELTEVINRLNLDYDGSRDNSWFMGTYHVYRDKFIDDLLTSVDSQDTTDKKISERVDSVVRYLEALQIEWNKIVCK
jgi:hypothetical protein